MLISFTDFCEKYFLVSQKICYAAQMRYNTVAGCEVSVQYFWHFSFIVSTVLSLLSCNSNIGLFYSTDVYSSRRWSFDSK